MPQACGQGRWKASLGRAAGLTRQTGRQAGRQARWAGRQAGKQARWAGRQAGRERGMQVEGQRVGGREDD